MHGYTIDDHDFVHWIFTLYLCAFLTSILGLAGHLSNLFVDAVMDFSHYLKVIVFFSFNEERQAVGKKDEGGKSGPKIITGKIKFLLSHIDQKD